MKRGLALAVVLAALLLAGCLTTHKDVLTQVGENLDLIGPEFIGLVQADCAGKIAAEPDTTKHDGLRKKAARRIRLMTSTRALIAETLAADENGKERREEAKTDE